MLRGGGAILYGPLQYSDFGSSMALGYNQNRDFYAVQNAAANTGGAFTPAFRLDSSSTTDPTNPSVGFPAVSYAPNLDPTQLTAQNGPGSFTAVGGEVIRSNWGRPAMVNNWSLELQDQVAEDLSSRLAISGNRRRTCIPAISPTSTTFPRSISASAMSCRYRATQFRWVAPTAASMHRTQPLPAR